MGIRDEEIKRLVHYAKGMGVTVTFHHKANGKDVAEWTLDGTEIHIYISKDHSKTFTILSLIHEIGHHVWFIHEKDRQPDLKFSEAIGRENSDSPTPKRLRKKIYNVELAGTKWWEMIYKETNIKIPWIKVQLAMDMDVWHYEYYYEYGKMPSRKLARAKKKEFRDLYRGTNV